MIHLLAVAAAAVLCVLRCIITVTNGDADGTPPEDPGHYGRRRLEETKDDADAGAAAGDRWFHDVPRALSLALRPPPPPSSASAGGTETEPPRLRVLLVVTSLVERDRGTRGTQRGYDRLRHVVLPALVDAASSMTERGWRVDVYLVLGYEKLAEERRRMIREALGAGVGLEVWEDATPLHYAKTYNKRPKADQALTLGDHALSRQHRFVLRDKLPYYDFFACFVSLRPPRSRIVFVSRGLADPVDAQLRRALPILISPRRQEDDMRITANHVVNFLQLSSDIRDLHVRASASPDRRARVAHASPPRTGRHAPNDGAAVGNDVVDDPIRAEDVRRLFPGLLRVEVVDRDPDHPLRRPGALDRHGFAAEVPPSGAAAARSALDPTVCCDEDDPPRGRTVPRPTMDEAILWETNIQATGVRRFPEPIGWAAAMPVEDRADVGSYWSGYPAVYGPNNVKRPRRIDATIGNQAGFMATRGQIEHFHETACPGGFLPPFDGGHWRGDSLQRHSVEFWSGGFQLFG